MSIFSKVFKSGNGGGGAERGGYSVSQAPKSPGLHASEVHVDPLLNAAGGYAGMKDADGKFLVGDVLMRKISQQFDDPDRAALVMGHVQRIREEEAARKAQQ